MLSVDKLGSLSGDNTNSNVDFTGPVLTNWSDTSGQLNITVVSPELVINQQYSVNISIDTAKAGNLSTMTHFGEWIDTNLNDGGDSFVLDMFIHYTNILMAGGVITGICCVCGLLILCHG